MQHKILTFTGGKVRVEIDNVWAALVASSRAELLPEVPLKQRIRGDADRVAVQATSTHALIGLDPICHVVCDHHTGCAALVPD